MRFFRKPQSAPEAPRYRVTSIQEAGAYYVEVWRYYGLSDSSSRTLRAGPFTKEQADQMVCEISLKMVFPL